MALRPTPPAGAAVRRRGLFTAVGLAAGLAVASLLPSADTLPLACVFRKVTTLPCPSCGMTHAFVAMGHGRWAEAWAANVAGPLLYVLSWMAAGLALAQGLTGREVLGGAWARVKRAAVPAVFIVAGLAWAAGLLRRFLG